MSTITTDDVLEAIRAAMETPQELDSEPGVTTTEIAEALDCNTHAARRYVRGLLKSGRMVAVRVRRLSMAGIPCEIAGYRLKT